MSNSFACAYTIHAKSSGPLGAELARIRTELESGESELQSCRKLWQPTDECPLRFVAPWYEAKQIQEALLRRLAAIDPTTIVENTYYEEFLQAVGVQLVRFQNGNIQWVGADKSLANAEDCPAEPDRHDSDDLDDMIATEQYEEALEAYLDSHQQQCRLKAFAALHDTSSTVNSAEEGSPAPAPGPGG
jgi:hypothetical protein